jgi:hypothetical protein
VAWHTLLHNDDQQLYPKKRCFQESSENCLSLAHTCDAPADADADASIKQ